MAVRGQTERKGSRKPTELESSSAAPNALDAADWRALVDNAGPFAPLSELRRFLATAPPEAQSLPEYHWLTGFLQGRELHEEFAGVDVEARKK
jgi:hypothetical protein